MRPQKVQLVGILATIVSHMRQCQVVQVDGFPTSTNWNGCAIATEHERRRRSSLVSSHVVCVAAASRSASSSLWHSRPLASRKGAGIHVGLAAWQAAAENSRSSNQSYRSYCTRCHRPPSTCLCHALPTKPLSLSSPYLTIRVLILQHPREARKRKRTGTVPLIGLCLEEVSVCVGTRFGCDEEDDDGSECPEALREVWNNQHKAGESVMLLYPGETAQPLHERNVLLDGQLTSSAKASLPNQTNQTQKKITLIVLDGTWAQTQAMYQQSPCLHQLPRYMFADDTDSLFDPIRHEPAKHCTSTLEAVSRALRILGSGNENGGNGDAAGVLAEAANALEHSLRAMVKGQMEYANDASKSRPRTKNNNNNNNNNSNGNRDGNAVIANKGRRVRKRRQAQLSLPKPMTEEEIEAARIRFIYVAHLG